MMQALRIAATGMQAQQTNVDVLSNNIANMNTTAFKQQIAAFQDLLYQSKIGVGAVTSSVGTIAPTGAQIGLGVNIGSVYRLMSQGEVLQTGNPFDMAIQGRGFFKVTMPTGDIFYTRDGSFQIDQNGQVVTKQGYSLDPSINIPQDAVDLTISQSGIVTGKVNGTTTNFGTITIAMFTNEAGLRNEGGNFYSETEASGTLTDANPDENGAGQLLQGFLESSNVNPIEAITRLITAQRAYELNSRVISTADEMLNSVGQIR
jgi:flagellar basal-body rod protein FlgG